MPSCTTNLHEFSARRTWLALMANRRALVATRKRFSARQCARRAFPSVASMLLDVWMATTRWLGAELWTRRVQRTPIVFAEHRLRGGAAIACDCDGE